MNNRRMVTFILALVGTFLGPIDSTRAVYPEKPITVIVPWPAGGLSEVQTRTIAKSP